MLKAVACAGMLLAAGLVRAYSGSPAENGYGVNAHLLARNRPVETASVDRICRCLSADGLGTMRVGFSWGAVQEKRGKAYDFSAFDRIFDCAARHGLRILPLLKGPPGWARPVWRHLDDWREFVGAFVERYGDRIGSVEIWNEENTKGFWKNPRQVGTWQDPYVEDYVDLLKVSYETVKSVRPSVRVAIGGFSGVPMRYIRKLYAAGANRYFDVMNVHPYSRPLAPEGSFDTRIEELRAFMDAHGDAHKPIRVSEVGWPTHRVRAEHPELLAEGLLKARPDKKVWRIAYAQFEPGVDDPDGSLLKVLEGTLPAGSRIVPMEQADLAAALPRGEFDAVLMPLLPDFRTEALAVIQAYVKRGGVLVWFGKRFSRPQRRNAEGFIVPQDDFDHATFRKFFRYAQEDRKQEFGAAVLRPSGLGDGDVFEPLREVKDKGGKTFVTAAVIRYASDLKGAVVLSGYDEAPGGTSETLQSWYLVRMMAMAGALGVANVEYYEVLAPEKSPFESEHHYGLWHSDLSPKPAYRAYCEYIRRRPVGSANRTDLNWKSSDGVWFSPQWTRPDGTNAGLLWKRGRTVERTMSFGAGDVRFFDLFGAPVAFPRGPSAGTYRIRIGEAPVYWESAEGILACRRRHRPDDAELRIVRSDGATVTNVVALNRLPDGTLRFLMKASDVPKDAVCLEVVPECMAARAGEDGFWVLPDGRYGTFRAVEGMCDYGQHPRRTLMPIHGMKTPRGAHLAIVRGLRHDCDFLAKAEKGVYSLSTFFRLDELGGRVPYEDLIVDYIPLATEEATYAGMARRYRNERLARGEVRPLSERIKDHPTLAYTAESIFVRVKHGWKALNTEKEFLKEHEWQSPTNEPPVKVSISFDRYMDIMRRMKDLGIEKAEMCSVGGTAGGFDGRFPDVLPLPEEFGGTEKFKEAVRLGQSFGYQMVAHFAVTAMLPSSRRFDCKDVCWKPDGSLLFGGIVAGGRTHRLCPKAFCDKMLVRDWAEFKSLGLKGTHHIDVVSCIPPYACYNPKHPLNFEESAACFRRIGEYSREVFGGFGSESGFDWMAPALDFALYVSWFPGARGREDSPIVDRIVPFWQLVYHGIVVSNPFYATIDAYVDRSKERQDFSDEHSRYGYLDDSRTRILKVHEFGGRPVFYYTEYRDVMPLKRAADDYAKYSHLQYAFMDDHRELAQGVFLTHYSTGAETVTNYALQPYHWKGQVVEPRSIRLFE